MCVTSPAVKRMVFKHSNTGITRQDQNQPLLLLSIRPPTSDVLASRPAPSSPHHPPGVHRGPAAFSSLYQQFKLIHQLQPVAVPLPPPMASLAASRKQNRQLTEMTTPTTAVAVPRDHLPQPLQVHITTGSLMKPTMYFYAAIY